MSDEDTLDDLVDFGPGFDAGLRFGLHISLHIGHIGLHIGLHIGVGEGLHIGVNISFDIGIDIGVGIGINIGLVVSLGLGLGGRSKISLLKRWQPRSRSLSRVLTVRGRQQHGVGSDRFDVPDELVAWESRRSGSMKERAGAVSVGQRAGAGRRRRGHWKADGGPLSQVADLIEHLDSLDAVLVVLELDKNAVVQGIEPHTVDRPPLTLWEENVLHISFTASSRHAGNSNDAVTHCFVNLAWKGG